MENLWKENSPERFWQCYPSIENEIWQQAVGKAYSVLGLPQEYSEIDSVYSLVLGEGQFGIDRYKLSKLKRIYYEVKPFLPRFLINVLKKTNSKFSNDHLLVNWPVDDRYVQFQWEIMRNALIITGQSSIRFKQFWPEGKQFAFVLTHDVESGAGQSFVRAVADLEEMLGFRSSFNFVPEKYPLDIELMEELRDRGFEVGVHGLKHDGKLFFSNEEFLGRVEKINKYLYEFGAVGFRSPLTHRNPEWMQSLGIEYDLSFFDTDPYEPMPGGSMSIWPFTIGNFIELPYTLVQDSTLRFTLEENNPRLWLEKVNFLKKYFGMALLNSHPDYLRNKKLFQIYGDFLKTIQRKGGYWHALPKEVATWWKERSFATSIPPEKMPVMGTINIGQGEIQIT